MEIGEIGFDQDEMKNMRFDDSSDVRFNDTSDPKQRSGKSVTELPNILNSTVLSQESKAMMHQMDTNIEADTGA